jgi:hypothetical protein
MPAAVPDHPFAKAIGELQRSFGAVTPFGEEYP